jgi:hypothetical protein
MEQSFSALRKIDERAFLLCYVQPGLVGLIDGTLSTLAPIFAAALLSGSHAALFVGLATAVGAGISMGFSEALSDDGTQTGRGSAIARGVVTGAMTTVGGVFHSLPFLIGDVHTALVIAGIVVANELIAISLIRKRFLAVSLRTSLLQVALGGVLIVAAGVLLAAPRRSPRLPHDPPQLVARQRALVDLVRPVGEAKRPQVGVHHRQREVV